MNNEESVNAQIDKEFKAWNEAKFDLEPLPKDFIERFKKAVFLLAPKAHQLSSMTIEKIISKKLKDITNYEVPVIINAIQLLPMCEYGKDIDEALKKIKEIENIKLGYNIMVQKLNHEMEQKRKRMISLSSGRTTMKIIDAQA